MTPGKEERVRERAYQIWEAAGRPHGHHDEHWRQAGREIDANDADQPKASDVAGKAGLVVDAKAKTPELSAGGKAGAARVQRSEFGGGASRKIAARKKG